SKAGRLSKTANLRLLGGFHSSRCALRLGRCLLCFCCSFGSSLLCFLRFLRSLCRLLFCLLACFFFFFCLFRINLLRRGSAHQAAAKAQRFHFRDGEHLDLVTLFHPDGARIAA